MDFAQEETLFELAPSVPPSLGSAHYRCLRNIVE